MCVGGTRGHLASPWQRREEAPRCRGLSLQPPGGPGSHSVSESPLLAAEAAAPGGRAVPGGPDLASSLDLDAVGLASRAEQREEGCPGEQGVSVDGEDEEG